MDLHTATATGGGAPSATTLLIAAGLALVWAAGYVVACAIWPFAACGRCKGTGKRRSPTGKAWRRCGRCKGGGSRLRVGRHVWNYLHTKSKDAA